MTRTISVIKILFFLLFYASGINAEGMKDIVNANDLYKQGKYKDSTEIYEQIEGEGYVNGHLFYNMGNAYYKQGKIGKALLSYNKAKILLPRDEDLQANFDFLKKEIKDQTSDSSKSASLQTVFFWVYMFNLQEFLYSLFILHGVLFLFLTVRIFYKGAALKVVITIAGIFYIIAAGSLLGRYVIEKNRDHGIVLADEINVRSGIGFDNVILFKLHEGADFKIEEEKESWLKIVLNDGKRGWVEKGFVGVY